MTTTLRLAVWSCVLSAILLGAYTWYLVKRLDVSRETVEARARGVEATVVPSVVAGPQGAAFNATLEVPLSLPPERIPDLVKNAFMTSEDQLFRWHPGFNPVSLVRAAMTNARREPGEGRRRVGGSTITQQFVKNVLLSQEQTFDRKVNELLLALVVEWHFTKDEIMAMYLNTAYFGDGAYGIEAAARRFFGRSIGYAPQVNALEAAMLALSVRRPSRANPSSQRVALQKQGRALLAEMKAQGYAIGTGKGVRGRGARTWKLDPFLFRDVAMRSMVPAEIARREDSVTLGLTVDSEAQLYAELAATNLFKEGRAAGYDNAAIIVMEPDGAIVALATGNAYNGVDLVKDGRVSPGSTLKPFMFLCALQHGLRPRSPVRDDRRAFRKGWTVRNFDRAYLGPITLDTALARSRNTVAVALYDKFGADCFAENLGRAGIKLDRPGNPTAVLGSEPVSLLRLAAAYAALANGGHRVEPYAIRYAREKRGAVIYRRPVTATTEPVAKGQPYCDLLAMLRNVTRAGGTGHKAAFAHPVYGKTGTSSDHRDALFAGLTRHYTTVVWLGRQAPGKFSGRMTGGELPAETFKWLMATLHEGKPVGEIPCRAAAPQVAARDGMDETTAR